MSVWYIRNYTVSLDRQHQDKREIKDIPKLGQSEFEHQVLVAEGNELCLPSCNLASLHLHGTCTGIHTAHAQVHTHVHTKQANQT